ncbi:MAG: TonB-dependent receptor [Thiothrix sp.]|nr:MAG: TonB-dependent receptor [Thiothrix sp.]
MKTSLLTVLGSVSLSAVFSPSLVWAEPANNEIEIIITAGRKAQTADETLAPVTVITRKEIAQTQASTIAEVLQQTPGLTLTSSGYMGKQTSVHLRGTNDSHVLVLIDGVKVGSATLGTTPLELLPLAQVERIEIVRGPRSSLYGSEAIGGVIQIFTRKGSGSKGMQSQASASYGSFNTAKASAGMGGGSGEGAWFNLNVATERTDGINAQDFYTTYLPDFSTAKVYESDKDGYKNNSFSLRAGNRFENGMRAEAGVMQAQGESDYDGEYQNENHFKQQVTQGKFSAPVGSNATVTAQLGHSLDKQDSYKDSVFKDRFQTKRTSASLQADMQFGAVGNLTAGFDQIKDKVSGTTDYAVTSRKNTGLFASYQLTADDNKFDISVRQDDNEQFGKKATGGVAFAHEVSESLRVTASYGTAFKAPTFNDLYYPWGGNPDLNPENSKNLELGIAGRLASGEWAIAAFQNKIDDLIQWRDTGAGVWKPMNVAAAKITGLEISAAQRLGEWQISGNASFQNPKVASGEQAGDLLINRPKQIFNLDAERQLGRISVGAAVHAEGRRYNDTANLEALAGFGTLDLRAKYEINRDLAVSAKLANILDKDYELRKGYNQPGVNGMLTLEYQTK